MKWTFLAHQSPNWGLKEEDESLRVPTNRLSGWRHRPLSLGKSEGPDYGPQ
jgi:hypothetical protein